MNTEYSSSQVSNSRVPGPAADCRVFSFILLSRRQPRSSKCSTRVPHYLVGQPFQADRRVASKLICTPPGTRPPTPPFELLYSACESRGIDVISDPGVTFGRCQGVYISCGRVPNATTASRTF